MRNNLLSFALSPLPLILLAGCTTYETEEDFAAAESALASGHYDEAVEYYSVVDNEELEDAVAAGLRTAMALSDLNAADRALRDGEIERAVNLFCRPDWSRVPDYKIPPIEADSIEILRRKLVVALEERLSSDPILLEHPEVLLPKGLELDDLGILPQGLERTIRHYRAWGFHRAGDTAAAWCETVLLRDIGGVYEADRLREELEPLIDGVFDELPRREVELLDYSIELDEETIDSEGVLTLDYTLLTPGLTRQSPSFCVISREPPGFRQVAALVDEPSTASPILDGGEEYAPVYRIETVARSDLANYLDRELYIALRIYGGQRAFKNISQLLDSFLPLLRLKTAD